MLTCYVPRPITSRRVCMPGFTESERRSIGRKLVQVLRHTKDKEKVPFVDGTLYCRTEELIRCRAIRKYNLSLRDLAEIVNHDDKSRYSCLLDDEDSEIRNPRAARLYIKPDDVERFGWIKANQGHSLPRYSNLRMAVRKLASLDPRINYIRLTEILNEQPDAICQGHYVFHGTYRDTLPRIFISGYLKRMTRTHIHFARCIPLEIGCNWITKPVCTEFDEVDRALIWNIYGGLQTPGSDAGSTSTGCTQEHDSRSSTKELPYQGIRRNAEVAFVWDIKGQVDVEKWLVSLNQCILYQGDLDINTAAGIVDLSDGSFFSLLEWKKDIGFKEREKEAASSYPATQFVNQP